MNPTFLSPAERGLLVKLIDTGEALARAMEARLPPVIGTQHWIREKHSPSPWDDLYWQYLCPDQHGLAPLAREEFEALSLRATLAKIGVMLASALHQSEQAVKGAPDLRLKKQKRQTY